MLLMANWTFLTSPPGAPPGVAYDPEVRLRDPGGQPGHHRTQRLRRTLTDLAYPKWLIWRSER